MGRFNINNLKLNGTKTADQRDLIHEDNYKFYLKEYLNVLGV